MKMEKQFMISYTVEGSVAVIKFDRGGKRNALTQGIVDELRDAFVRFEKSEQHVAVFTGSRESFTAGADLTDPPKDFWRCVPGVGVPMSKPLISAVSGWCVGGGMVLVQMSDLCIADETARFWFSEAKVGRGGGLITSLVARIPHKLAMEIMLIGDPIDAKRAYEGGLVNQVVPNGMHLETAMTLAQKIGRNAPLVVKMLKQFSIATLNRSPAEIMATARNTVDEIARSEDCAEGMQSFKERRPPVYRGL